MFDHPFQKQASYQTDNMDTLKYVFDILSFFWIFSTFFAQDLGIQITRCWRIISTGGFIQRRSVHAPGGEGSQTSNSDGNLKITWLVVWKKHLPKLPILWVSYVLFAGNVHGYVGFPQRRKGNHKFGSTKRKDLSPQPAFWGSQSLCQHGSIHIHIQYKQGSQTQRLPTFKALLHSFHSWTPFGPYDYPMILEGQLGPTFQCRNQKQKPSDLSVSQGFWNDSSSLWPQNPLSPASFH